MKILHIIPESFNNPQFEYSGSTKDIYGRVEYFQSRSLDATQVFVGRSDYILKQKLASLHLEEYSVVFIEFPIYPRSMWYIRKNHPHVKLYCRSINAELFHKFDLYLSNVREARRQGGALIVSMIKNLPVLRKMMYQFWQDIVCGVLSDVTLTITEWEKKHYWRYFTGKKARTLPFFLPDRYASTLMVEESDKKDRCVLLMGTKIKEGSFLIDSFHNFVDFVTLLGNEMPSWSFAITGELPANYISLPSRIKVTGFIENPYLELTPARAVAILSPYGRGFKTKILESILARCYVLVPEQLMTRLPESVKPFCVVVDLNSVDSFRQALQQCAQPFPAIAPNRLLKNDAFRVLDELFAFSESSMRA